MNAEIEKIRKLAAQYDGQNKSSTGGRKERLQTLVDQHGLDKVSAASGLKPASILQYLRNIKITVAEYPLSKAEAVLSQI